METINDRLRLIRNALNLSQSAMASRLGITGAGISRIEIGERALTEQMAKSICREFGVSYAYLKTCEGEMFEKTDDLNALIGRVLSGESEKAKAAFRAFAKLDESDWDVIWKLIKNLIDEMPKE